jgi:alkylation response protein AidB-like acyl-CoA dehydrogenase
MCASATRKQPIYGGTNEIMKDIIGRDLFASNKDDATRA